MSRPAGMIAMLKCYIGIIICVFTMFSAATGNADISDVTFKFRDNLTTKDTQAVYEVTNHTKYIIYHHVDIVKLEKEEDGEWKKIVFIDQKTGEEETDINQYLYSLMAAGPRSGSIFPGETFEWTLPLNLMFGKDTPDEGHYRLTYEYRLRTLYSSGDSEQIASGTYEFDVDPA